MTRPPKKKTTDSYQNKSQKTPRFQEIERGVFLFMKGTFMENPEIATVRISLPSKGRLAEESITFLDACGLSIYKPNPRQYQATIKDLPGVTVLFQRPGDIVTSVRDGSVDFGLSGLDVIEERKGDDGDVLVLHEALGFGACALALAVPENWADVNDIADLRRFAAALARPLRIATKYPVLTGRFLDQNGISHTTQRVVSNQLYLCVTMTMMCQMKQ